MEKDKASIVSALIVFKEIENDFAFIGQNMLDNDVDYRYVRRLQTIDIKLKELIDLMKGDLK